MSQRALLYEGKAKKVYVGDRPDELWVEFKDDATAFNGQKRGQIADKGIVNSQVSARLFTVLEQAGVPTHYLGTVDERTLRVRRLRMIPLEVVVRNRVAGSLHQRTGLAEGTALKEPVVELYYKNDALGDPLLNDDHVRALELAPPAVVEALRSEARRINQVLSRFFADRGLILVDFKLEFGWDQDRLCLGDEISPDTCRLWDQATLEKLDKDRFRRDLGGVAEAYRQVLARVMQ
ncbi:MAG: phosphoribosylaminoimidazolesuccinocarboxamide synthase [Firmicutes bacterium]|nr:phosphoribosylaminoimidazolesuccinocarboxamide synthase [Alicyclobacillaceae bacterium]MCL6497915.1 phosphoribosylaminoimidazolesuccinocarboxamide synthase [Bacillota bacterium]